MNNDDNSMNLIQRRIKRTLNRQSKLRIDRVEKPTHNDYIYYMNLKPNEIVVSEIKKIPGVVKNSVQVDGKFRHTTLTNRKVHCLTLKINVESDKKSSAIMTDNTEKIVLVAILILCLFVLGYFVGKLLT